MLGAIAGDIIGSPFEVKNVQSPELEPLFQPGSTFTDDTVLTLATADALLYGGDYTSVYQHYARRFPDAGYGGHFLMWSSSDDPKPYGSWGNGSAMRVSPVGWAKETAEEVVAEAARSAAVTHDHPEGVKGAQAIALAVYRARTGFTKEAIREETEERFGYDLGRTIDGIRPGNGFDVSCQGSVPEAIIAFLESDDFESAVRLAISLGGDSDTIACMAGAIAQAFYEEIPEAIVGRCRQLPGRSLVPMMDEFCERFGV